MKSIIDTPLCIPEGVDLDKVINLLFPSKTEEKKKEDLPVVVHKEKVSTEEKKQRSVNQAAQPKNDASDTKTVTTKEAKDNGSIDIVSLMKSMVNVLTNPVEPVTFVSDKVAAKPEYLQYGYIIIAKNFIDANPALPNKLLKISTELYKFEQLNSITDKQHCYFVDAFTNENEFRLREVSSINWNILDTVVASVEDGKLKMSATLPKAV